MREKGLCREDAWDRWRWRKMLWEGHRRGWPQYTGKNLVKINGCCFEAVTLLVELSYWMDFLLLKEHPTRSLVGIQLGDFFYHYNLTSDSSFYLFPSHLSLADGNACQSFCWNKLFLLRLFSCWKNCTSMYAMMYMRKAIYCFQKRLSKLKMPNSIIYSCQWIDSPVSYSERGNGRVAPDEADAVHVAASLTVLLLSSLAGTLSPWRSFGAVGTYPCIASHAATSSCRWWTAAWINCPLLCSSFLSPPSFMST